MENIVKYYDRYDENSRLIKDKVHLTEFITTTSILEGAIKEPLRILDVAAGTGRYVFHFADLGHQVTAIDIVPSHVDKIRCQVGQRNDIEVLVGDARDLAHFKDCSFDVVLCMGPFYHLDNVEEREQCLSECLRVLSKNGLLAVAYINKYAVFLREMAYKKDSLLKPYLWNILDSGREQEDRRNDFYFCSPEEIQNFMKTFNVTPYEHVATDGIGYLINHMVNGFTEEEYRRWIKYHLNTCSVPSLMGYSMHGLYICRKN